MIRRRPRFDPGQWLVRRWHRLPFVRHRGDPGLAGVREPRRPRLPFRPAMARSAEPDEGVRTPSVIILSRPVRRWWPWRSRAEHS